MCGIGGILRRDGEAIPDEWLDAIDARIAYRGPDGHGRFRDRVELETSDGKRTIEIALVHRRLAVIDPEGGHQPMVSERGRDDAEGLVAVVFNGCIYNHRLLRRELEKAGHAFVSDHSDTEVIIHGYREWGTKLTERLDGMYAFALWDRTNGSLVLARDWFGEKPLYVRWSSGNGDDAIVFASDARAAATVGRETSAQSPGIPIPGLSPQLFVQHYLQLGYNVNGRTIYDTESQRVRNISPTIHEGIDALMPGRLRETHTQADFEALIERAVETRLEADVPLGCFLSGGVDSSLIAHFAKKHMADVRTFSVRMPDERYDESAHAEVVAAYLGTNHLTIDVLVERQSAVGNRQSRGASNDKPSAECRVPSAVTIDPAKDLMHLIHTLGQPFGDSSILPTYWVSKAAREHVTVALSGDGGDELFIGYERYIAARHLNRHRRLLQWIPERWMRGVHPKSRWHTLGRLGQMARDRKLAGMAAMEAIFTQRQLRELFGERMQPPVHVRAGFDPMQALRRFDLLNYLPNDLFTKVDTASMAVDLEVRAPFLDRELVKAALSAPTHQLAPGGKRKGLLREIARKHLPSEVVDRPKMGFAIPVGEWFRNDFGGMRELLLEYLERDDPFAGVALNEDVIERLLAEHMSEACDHGQRLFALLTLAIWAEHMRTG